MKQYKIAVIGLGYVGLPLSLAFAEKYHTTAFDINEQRIFELNKGIDRTEEVTSIELLDKENISFTSNSNDLSHCNVYIIAVPTPVLKDHTPDLKPIIQATKLVGRYLSSGDIVIYESTVYPGLTEEVCVPILESASELKYNIEFFCGYSPERINPGDKTKNIKDIIKVTSGSTPEISDEINLLYDNIIDAGTFKAASIRVAEAAKVIENVQRDVNIALINELAMLFHDLEIDVNQVLDAACTKWNFLNFRPGVVGGHCVGVDPHYLTYKARSVGYYPKIITAGREINDYMGKYISSRVIKELICRQNKMDNLKILVLGFTFKENCPDLRNTKVIDIIRSLQSFNATVDCFDPKASKEEALREYNIELLEENPSWSNYNAVVYAVAHNEFLELFELNYPSIIHGKTFIFDLKNQLKERENIVRI